MANCEQQVRLTAYYDGEFSPSERTGVEEHVRHCPACQAELASMRRLSGLLSPAGAVRPGADELSPAALDRLHRSVDDLPIATLTRLAWPLAAAAAVILAFCSITLLGQNDDTRVAAVDLWETQALAQPADLSSGGTEELLAKWMVHDLSSPQSEEQP